MCDDMIKFNYGQEILNLPASVLSVEGADGTALKVLLWLASDPSLAEKHKQLAKLADCNAKEIKAAIAFWKAAGVITEGDDSAVAVSATPVEAPKKLRRAEALPQYTTTELSELLEARESIRALVDESQQLLGKMFNPGEVNILIGMLDYLGMNEEYILLMMAHCKKIGKTNLRSIEKYAYTLLDRGITDTEALNEELLRAEAVHTMEGQVRSMFGMRSRSLTSKEEKMLRQWMEFGYGIDIVKLAYDITVTATNEPSMVYANSVLETWHAEGLTTPEEIEKYQESRKKKLQKGSKGAPAAPTLGNSFDTDDFFEAALRRSLDDADPQ